MTESAFYRILQSLLSGKSDRSATAKRVADAIAAERHYRWAGLYEVTTADIGMIACTGNVPPAFPRFPLTKGLCGSAVATRSVVNVGNVQEDPRWLTTFGSTRSEIIVPIFHVTRGVIGLIDVESDSLDAFTKDDEQFLSACAPLLLPLFP